MNILYIWDGDYPWDIRVDKVCNSLQKNGYNVHVVCRNIARKKRREQYNGYNIHRLPFLPKWMKGLNNLFTFPAFFSPIWLWMIYKISKEENCKLILNRDLPMALAGIVISKLLDIPCVLDMAECYPELLRSRKQFERMTFINFFVRNSYLAEIVENISIKNVSQIWVMIEESRDRFLKKGVNEENLKIISNTPVFDRFSKQKSKKGNRNIYHMIYVGLLNPSRGLDTAIEAVGKYIKKNKNFKFTIVGKGKDEIRLKNIADKLGISNYVDFLGWVDHTKVPLLILNSDIGIVPHHNTPHWSTTIPNKLFDYMASNIPVIVSDVAPMKRIVSKVNCGKIFYDYDSNNLSLIIEELEDQDLRRNLANNGRTAIKEKYNWGVEELRLCNSLSKILDAKL
jgi:glycosyltransferase involved in cell wall biosynthesis